MRETIGLILTVAVMGYGLAMVAGGPKLANRYANWLAHACWQASWWLATLPFRLLWKKIRPKKKGKKKKGK